MNATITSPPQAASSASCGAGQAARTGPDGPEPPRAADSTRDHRPGPGADVPRGHRCRPGYGISHTQSRLAGVAEQGRGLPPELIADERPAPAVYPDVILLGTRFAIAELTDGRWQSFPDPRGTTHPPRPALPSPPTSGISHPRRKTSEETDAAYARAADELEYGQLKEITAAGRRFRISRVERYVRTGPAGPEPPGPATTTSTLPHRHLAHPRPVRGLLFEVRGERLRQQPQSLSLDELPLAYVLGTAGEIAGR